MLSTHYGKGSEKPRNEKAVELSDKPVATGREKTQVVLGRRVGPVPVSFLDHPYESLHSSSEKEKNKKKGHRCSMSVLYKPARTAVWGDG